MNKMKTRYQGFTLIEVLMVVTLLIFLFAIVIVAINPAKHLRDARNTQRSSDVTQVLNAALQYTADMGEENQTRYPGGDGDFDLQLPECGDGFEDIAEAGQLEDLLVDDYIAALPKDPHDAEASGETGYLICYDEFDEATDTPDGRIVVASELAEDPYEGAEHGATHELGYGENYIKVRR